MSTDVQQLAERSAALGTQIHELCKGQGPTVIISALCVCLGKALAVSHKVTGTDLEDSSRVVAGVVLKAARDWLANFNKAAH